MALPRHSRSPPAAPRSTRYRQRAPSYQAIDQRGVKRPQGSACDIGAFEFAVHRRSRSPLPPTAPATRLGSIVSPLTAAAKAGSPARYATCKGTVANRRPIDTSSIGTKSLHRHRHRQGRESDHQDRQLHGHGLATHALLRSDQAIISAAYSPTVRRVRRRSRRSTAIFTRSSTCLRRAGRRIRAALASSAADGRGLLPSELTPLCPPCLRAPASRLAPARLGRGLELGRGRDRALHGLVGGHRDRLPVVVDVEPFAH